ncbi:thiamine pyrophosphate-dependent enzyme [Jatrophihabitans lederbergiae]|uniref:Thiamine pyrophosphate-dependent enzyme n=1 Tax=Jatrophihabitans lederbergiae TaxID=3075547 RepID=A0ABU2JBP1_9ACTN|nr:thiamine pyrophosphate-dependent enzyme [Jatrophihabitans sp. DSM 44399]MDT0262409.1 thiamine pyrophosphate-dependent enzyme [Jatrophihabitans sp. DSM 44399]
MPDELHALDEHFRDEVGLLERGPARALTAPVRAGSALSVQRALELFTAQCESRHADLAAIWMQSRGRGFYTISSSGHEGNAGVAAALRPDDPALLHYRSGGFYCARSRQKPGHDPVRDILFGVAAATGEPIAGGRHKVFGNADLAVIPQTSTIASHLPRAVGLAYSLDRARRTGVQTPWSRDAIVVTSFGDASVNHSTLVGAFNTASNTVYQGLPMPVLMVCEDNGIGISTRTPSGWIAERFATRPGLKYIAVNGCDLADVYDAAEQAAHFVRTTRKPAFLHLRTVRFLGHAGSDAEVAYRTPAEITADYARDPLLVTAQLLADAGAADGAELLQRYEAVRKRVRSVAVAAMAEPQLGSADAIMAPLAPRDRVKVAEAVTAPAAADRQTVFSAKLPEDEPPLTLAQSINRALHDELARRPQTLLFGEDVSLKGGVYGVTRGLRKSFGVARVFDTILDEQAVLGVGLGSALAGFLPIPEIQYLAYLHNAEDQLRGEAATLQFFSQGQYRNPMVVRIAGLGYQKGFGGHFHNDNSVSVLRDIPGLVVAVPSHPSDAPAMLRTLLAAAVTDGTVSVFLEPIALYHRRDLHSEGDGGWLAPYAGPDSWAERHIPIGRARRWVTGQGDGSDLTILTFGNGVPMSLRVAHTLAADGVSSRVVDLRWLSPLPVKDILREAAASGQVLIVDETRRSGGVSEGIIAALVDGGFRGTISRVNSADSFIPLGDAARSVLLDEATVLRAARALVGG